LSQIITNIEWDSSFFEYNVFKVNKRTLSSKDELSQILDELAKLKAKLCYWPTDPKDNLTQDLIAALANAKLVDKKTIYQRSLKDWVTKLDESEDSISQFETSLTEELLELAIASGGMSRFFIDENFVNQEGPRLYTKWIEKALEEDQTVVFVSKNSEGELDGMLTLTLEENRQSKVGLIAVSEKSRGKGIGKRLINTAFCYAKNNSANDISIVTQASNLAACGLYESFGCEITEQVNFYHIWS